MALSPDVRIRYALSDSVLEELGDDRERLVKARLKMGPATLTRSHPVERDRGRE